MKSLAERMKRYELVCHTHAARRVPLIIRVDGRAFHTLTRNIARPFDIGFIRSMRDAAAAVTREMQGFKLAYIQSDEVSFLLTDYDQLTSEAWFDYDVSKLLSITASLMSVNFSCGFKRDAVFDARVIPVPESDVINYFLWRAKDWARNSLQMFARAHFSHKELHKKNHTQIHEMLYTKGFNWSNLEDVYKNGTFMYHELDTLRLRSDVLPTYEAINNVFLKLPALSRCCTETIQPDDEDRNAVPDEPGA